MVFKEFAQQSGAGPKTHPHVRTRAARGVAWAVAWGVAALSLAGAGCIQVPEVASGDVKLRPDTPEPGQPARVEAPQAFSVSVDASRPLAELGAVVKDASGVIVPGVALTYTLTDDLVAKVSDTDLQGLSPGRVSLTISANSVDGVAPATVQVHVLQTRAITLPETLSLDVGQREPLSQRLQAAGVAAQDRASVTWTLEPTSVATLEGDELVGMQAGQATLKATLLHLEATTRVVVRRPPKGIFLEPPVVRLSSEDGVGPYKTPRLTLRSIDDQGQLRELAPGELPCATPRWTILSVAPWTNGVEFRNDSEAQITLLGKTPSPGRSAVEVSCDLDGVQVKARAIVEVMTGLQISAGGAHTCATNAQQQLRCWGSNERGQLGLRERASVPFVSQPDQTMPLGPYALVSAGAEATCAIQLQGGVDCWDARWLGDQDAAVLPPELLAQDLSVGYSHAAAVLADGGLYTWGRGPRGQLGRPGQDALTIYQPPAPVVVQGVSSWMRVSAGHDHTCALTTSGELYCWGDNSSGQLGDGTTESSPAPVRVGASRRWLDVAAGRGFTCAVDLAHQVFCWGAHQEGQLGRMEAARQPSTPLALGGGEALSVQASERSACALVMRPNLPNGLFCWGDNLYGQLGRSPAVRAEPGLVEFGPNEQPDVRVFGLGARHACAFEAGAPSPRCWGAQQQGRVGDGQLGMSQLPLPHEALPDSSPQSVSARVDHGCASTDENPRALDSNVLCWGLNRDGQAGILPELGLVVGRFNQRSVQVPESVQDRPKDQRLSTLFTGPSHTCGLDAEGRAFCWGRNDAGQLGAATAQAVSARMVRVQGDRTFSALALGQGFTCGISREPQQRVYCWGDTSQGRASRASSCTDPQCPVVAMRDAEINVLFSHVAAAESSACAMGIVQAGAPALACWGAQLKDSSGAPLLQAALYNLELGDTLELLAAGRGHYCAIIKSESGSQRVLCWGDNSEGQSAPSSPQPYVAQPSQVMMPELGSQKLIGLALGDDHSCVLARQGTAPGRLVCWGRNAYGQMGTSDATLPQALRRTPGLGAYSVVDARGTSLELQQLYGGATSMCGLINNRVRCWGDHSVGQLGTHPVGYRLPPFEATLP